MSQRVAHFPPVVATGEPEGWEIIFCVYTMISLNYPAFLVLHESKRIATEVQKSHWVYFYNHQQWHHESG